MSKLLSDFNENGVKTSNVALTRIYSDLDLSLIINPLTKDLSVLTDTAAVKNAIKNLVLTNFYECPFNPEVGSGITSLLFEPANMFTQMEIRTAIINVINNYEPRATDVSVNVIDNSDQNSYVITVKFRVFYNDLINEFDFHLQRLR